MTSEEWARAKVIKLTRQVGISADHKCSIVVLPQEVEQALLEARDQALEEACKVVVNHGDENAPYYESRAVVCEGIRSLKSKGQSK